MGFVAVNHGMLRAGSKLVICPVIRLEQYPGFWSRTRTNFGYRAWLATKPSCDGVEPTSLAVTAGAFDTRHLLKVSAISGA